MRRALTAVVLTSLLGGCTTLTIGGIAQVNRATEPFPPNYLATSAEAVVGLPVVPGQSLAISYPQPTIGTTAMDPQRWYVCVRGVKPLPGASDTQPILVFGRFGTPLLVRTSVDYPCRNATGYQNLPRT